MSTIKTERLYISPKCGTTNKVTQPRRPATVSFLAAVRTPKLILPYLQTVALFAHWNWLQHISLLLAFIGVWPHVYLFTSSTDWQDNQWKMNWWGWKWSGHDMRNFTQGAQSLAWHFNSGPPEYKALLSKPGHQYHSHVLICSVIGKAKCAQSWGKWERIWKETILANDKASFGVSA
jgi:hypothetical protein